MFDILVYLYETYYRPEAFPAPEALARKLSAVGFDEEDISEAIDWLRDLTQAAETIQQLPDSSGFRVYTTQESAILGCEAIGFITFLESANLLTTQQREIVIERALAIDDIPIPLDKIKIIVLMTVWNQGAEPNLFLFDELHLSNEEITPPVLH